MEPLEPNIEPKIEAYMKWTLVCMRPVDVVTGAMAVASTAA
jgi:hypothetical protein